MPWATCWRLHGARTSISTRAKVRPGRSVVTSGGRGVVRLFHHGVVGWRVTPKARPARSVPLRASIRAKPSWRRWTSNRLANRSACSAGSPAFPHTHARHRRSPAAQTPAASADSAAGCAEAAGGLTASAPGGCPLSVPGTMLASRAWRRASENPGRYLWGGDRAEARVTGGRTAGPAAVRAAIACTKARRPCLDRRRRHLAGRQRRPRHRRARGAAIRGTIRSWVRPQTGTRRA